jgi:cytochrome P450
LPQISIFSDPRVKADQSSVYAELRKGPPKWSDAYGGHWVAARYEDLMTVLNDPDLFCSGQGSNLPPNGFPYRFPPGETDPPEHGKYRKLAAPFFTSTAMARLEPLVREVTRECIASFVARGRADLATELGQLVPANVIADMMGFPRADAPWFAHITDRLLETAERPELAEENAAAGAELVGYLTRHIEARRKQPQPDLLTDLVNGQIDGGPMTPEDLLGMSFFLLIAGHETTVGGITYLLWQLGRQPDLRAKISHDPSLIRSAIEESLRLHGPVLHLARTVTRDTDLGGSALKSGDKVMALYAAANLDDLVFPDAHTFDLSRPNLNKHVAFSAGIHKCQGAAMGRLEMRVVLEEVLAAIPDYELGEGIAFRSAQGARSLKHLPVTFTPVPSS